MSFVLISLQKHVSNSTSQITKRDYVITIGRKIFYLGYSLYLILSIASIAMWKCRPIVCCITALFYEHIDKSQQNGR